MHPILSTHKFTDGALTALPALDERQADCFAAGSRNQLLLGVGKTRPWRGMTSMGANTGSRKMLQIGKTWGGIKDIGGTQGAGSFFEDIGRSLWSIGAGQPHIEGTDLSGITLSTILQVSIAVAGVYTAGNTFAAGLGQPSTPDVGILDTPGAGYDGIIEGPVSFKIARLRLTTGARSIASGTSAVLVPSKKSIFIIFPLAASGQTHWRAFSTQEGFGGVGLHYALKYGVGTAAVLDIPEATVAAGTAGGFSRSLEFDYKTGDLVPEVAYIDDYPPPAGTHAVRLENVMCVLGAYGDSTTAVTSTSTGTVGAISLPNFYESYKPSHRVYFPEQIVDHRARATDSYCYIAHRNSITALQYIGLRDGPAVALTMVLPETGIEKPHNWCQVGGLLYARVADGSFIRMRPDGSIDYGWTDRIADSIKDWDNTTIVGWHPTTMSVVISNGTEAWSFSLLNERWSPVCYYTDAGVAGTAHSAINSQGELYITLTSGGSQTAYKWDRGATKMPITSNAPIIAAETTRAVNVRELEVAFDSDRVADPLIVSVSRNLRQRFVRDAVTTAADSTVAAATGRFTGRSGDMVCIFGTDIGGSGIDFLIGRIGTVGSGTSFTLNHPTTGSPMTVPVSLSACYMVIAHQIFTYTYTELAEQHSAYLKEPWVKDCQSFSVGFSLITAATRAHIIKAVVRGNPKTGPMGKTT